MSDHRHDLLSRALLAYREELGELAPSAELDARLRVSMTEQAAQRRRSRVVRWVPWAVAAGLITCTAVLALHLASGGGPRAGSDKVAEAVVDAPVAPMGMGAVGRTLVPVEVPVEPASYVPAPTPVFRVRARLGAAAVARSADGATTEPSFWVDLSLDNDGSLRIVRVVPADGPEGPIP